MSDNTKTCKDCGTTGLHTHTGPKESPQGPQLYRFTPGMPACLIHVCPIQGEPVPLTYPH